MNSVHSKLATGDVAELTFLDGIDLAGQPPCTITVFANEHTIVPCDQAGTVRLKITLRCCGDVTYRFACEDHFSEIRHGAPWYCDTDRRSTTAAWEMVLRTRST